MPTRGRNIEIFSPGPLVPRSPWNRARYALRSAIPGYRLRIDAGASGKALPRSLWEGDESVMNGNSRHKKNDLSLAGAMLILFLLLSACRPADVPPVETALPPAVTAKPTLASPADTELTQPTPTPEDTPAPPTATHQPPAAQIEPVARGADIRIDSWSQDGAWLAYWLSTEEDLKESSWPAPPGKLHFVSPQTGQNCEHPELVSSEYGQQIIWQPDERAILFSDGEYWVGLPCSEFRPIAGAQVIRRESQDASLSPDGRFQAATTIHDRSGGVVRITTLIRNTSTGQLENSVEWEIDERLGDLGLGGEWVTQDLFILYETMNRGPLLIEAGGEAIKIAPELLGVPVIPPGDPRWDEVSLVARASSVEESGVYHILLSGIGIEANFPPVRLYHSETGEVETLPFKYLWRRGFSQDGRWVLLDARPDVGGYESYALWYRPVDPPGSEARLLAEGTPYDSWSPDGARVAFGRPGNLSVFTFPEGVQTGAWRTGDIAPYSLVWSPDGAWLAAAGDRALFIVGVNGGQAAGCERGYGSVTRPIQGLSG